MGCLNVQRRRNLKASVSRNAVTSLGEDDNPGEGWASCLGVLLRSFSRPNGKVVSDFSTSFDALVNSLRAGGLSRLS